ncbi:MAG: sulfatase-like hydrolase/transferase [Clostridiales bacterium]|nr:sulfatase-like hydrolase/transferase [Clostridiales bacterium]
MKKINLKKPNRNQVIRICNLLSVPLQFLGCCVLYLIIEAFSRHSLPQAWAFMTESPLIFLYNAFLIFTTSLVVYLFKRRILARMVVGSFWFILGCVNGFLLANRVTPFTGPDLKLITDAVRIMNKYLSPVMVGVVLAALGCLILFFVWIFRKGWKFQGKLRYWVNIPLILLAALAFAGTTRLALEKRVLSNYFGNIAYAYQDYGYPYCLAVTLFDTGINVPNGYSETLMNDIEKSEGEIKETKEKNTDVNILFLQLETFIDPTEINFLEFSEDPIPNFRKMMEKYSSGYYKVPSVGAGTANTEFESITGMSLRYFGAGEYPYKSILKEKTCESAAYVLKELGYGTHAIHNNEANFYGRRSVFSRLGFDTFTSEEYMPDISDTTPMGWVKDHILADEIFKAMESTEGPDYVYTISVQGHGDYPTEPMLTDPVIKVTGAESQERNYAWEYYVNQLYEMDQFLLELTERLKKFDERVVLVMYGDHLPTMDLKVEDMKNRYLFQTKYVMWSNFKMKKKDKNLAAYQMAAEVFNRLGIHEGTVFNYHQTRKGSRNYQLDLQALQYDLLYGEQYLYDKENPFKATKLQLGVEPAEFTSISANGENSYFVYGRNFTASSRLEVNKELQETKYISPSQLLVQNVELADGDVLSVATQSNSSTKKVLSRTDPLVYHAPEPEVTVTPEPGGTPEATGEPAGETTGESTGKASGESAGESTGEAIGEDAGESTGEETGKSTGKSAGEGSGESEKESAAGGT